MTLTNLFCDCQCPLFASQIIQSYTRSSFLFILNGLAEFSVLHWGRGSILTSITFVAIPLGKGFILTEYFIGWLINSIMIKSCTFKESYLVRVQIGLTWIVKAYIEAYSNNAIPDCDKKKHFLNRQVDVRIFLFRHLTI